MKIITDNAVYVQKEDINRLLHSDLEMLESIGAKVFDRDINVINNRNRFDFVEFTAPEEIELLRNADWIIDYNEVKI